MANTYAEKLKDPRWQKKRLEILQRDNFTCLKCKSTIKTLHVHHNTYTYGKEPWDYHNNNFKTLCFECHELEEYGKQSVNDIIHDILATGLSYWDIEQSLFKLMGSQIDNPNEK